MKLFTASDFIFENSYGDAVGIVAQRSADRANAILEKRLSEAVEVVCRNDNGKWACDEHTGFARATHKAKLLAITPIGEPFPWEKKE